MKPRELITYREVIEMTGLPKRTLLDRIDRAGVTVYVDGRDRRRRLLDKREVEQLIKPEAIEHHERVAFVA